jgi:hypothetical protein
MWLPAEINRSGIVAHGTESLDKSEQPWNKDRTFSALRQSTARRLAVMSLRAIREGPRRCE